LFGFGSKAYLLGLDIGSGSIKMLQLKESTGKLKVERFGMKPLPAEMIVDGSIMDGLGVVTAIKELATEQKLKNKNVALSISGTSVIVKKITLPPMPEEELDKQIKFEAEQYIPFDINDVYLDFHILSHGTESSPAQGEMEVLLVATKKDKLNDYANAVREAGLTPKVVDVDAFAVENMYCVNYDVSPAELTAIVNIGASVMNINILKGGVSAFTRDIAIGGNRYSERVQQDLALSLEDAEAAKKGQLPNVNADALHQAVAAVNEEVATEIGRSFDYFRTTSPDEDIARIVLCGGCSKIKSLPVKISEHLGIETSVANPFKKLDTTALKKSPEEIERVAPETAVVVGLALRREGDR
jgi:type IV pilus assembly protein PilM